MAFTVMWGEPRYRAGGATDLLLKGLTAKLYCGHMQHNLTNTAMKKRVRKHTFYPHKSVNNELNKHTKHYINPITISNTISTLSLSQTLYQPYHYIKHYISPLTISNITSTLSLYQTLYQP